MPVIKTVTETVTQEAVPDLTPVLAVFKRLSVSKTKGWQLIGSGQLETVKIGKKSYCTEFQIRNFVIRNVRANLVRG